MHVKAMIPTASKFSRTFSRVLAGSSEQHFSDVIVDASSCTGGKTACVASAIGGRHWDSISNWQSMATGPLRFRTPFIEELPTDGKSKQAPGFAWVAVSGPAADPAKNWGTTNKKRARGTGPQSESAREERSARQQRDIERKIRELNSDGAKDVQIPLPKKSETGGGGVRAGKTTNTKKILASGKTFAHYLDDEEAEIARTGRRDGELDPTPKEPQRASKTPLARRKPSMLQREESSVSNSPAPNSGTPVPTQFAPPLPQDDAMDVDDDFGGDEIDPLPTQAELEALLNAPPLTYNQARSAPPPPGAPPPRQFCEICGYWGRVKCMKCGNMTCSVVCKDAHDEHKCLKFYA